ncbi:hypothetical protein BBJ28_00017577 [Nothophytophthora sp. Chile5]|nr:hypothetical protein BBJ28_00017577 [Nothophytophthora sp. Chile5]
MNPPSASWVAPSSSRTQCSTPLLEFQPPPAVRNQAKLEMAGPFRHLSSVFSSSSASTPPTAHLKRHVVATLLPPRTAILEQLSLTVAAVRLSKRDVRYELQVTHAASHTSWRRTRSFDDYKAFQTRLLTALRHGHFCQAECPWLFTFLKSYFPSSGSLFGLGASSDCAAEKRRAALEHLLVALQKFVVNRQNVAACSIVAGRVSELVTAFIVGDVSDKSHPLNARSLSDSVCSPTSDEGDELIEEAEEAGVCILCSASLNAEAFRSTETSISRSFGSDSAESAPFFVLSSPSKRSNLPSYLTTLACGHQFHDECVVPQLNEELSCPTCRTAIDTTF